jgi:hypothetical protein
MAWDASVQEYGCTLLLELLNPKCNAGLKQASEW